MRDISSGIFVLAEWLRLASVVRHKSLSFLGAFPPEKESR
jgi:hypothetical protein